MTIIPSYHPRSEKTREIAGHTDIATAHAASHAMVGRGNRPGKDHVDQIRKIISTLGTPTEAPLGITDFQWIHVAMPVSQTIIWATPNLMKPGVPLFAVSFGSPWIRQTSNSGGKPMVA